MEAGNYGTYWKLNQDSAGFGIDYNGTGEKIKIDTSGNVGIGTTTPQDKLDVEGGYIRMSAGDGGLLRGYSSVGTLMGALSFGNSYDAAGIGDTILVNHVNSQQLYVVNYSGGVYLATAGDTSWTANSDERLKTNITPLSDTSGLVAIRQLVPITYNWKDVEQNASAGVKLGFTAQNMQQVFPELVSIGRTTTITLADGSTQVITDPLGISTTGLIPSLVKGIQELDTRTKFIENAATTTVLTVDVAGNVVSARVPQTTPSPSPETSQPSPL